MLGVVDGTLGWGQPPLCDRESERFPERDEPSSRGQDANADIGGHRALKGRGGGKSREKSDDDGYGGRGGGAGKSGGGGGADYSESTYEALKADIADMFLNSKDFWPADFGNYAPFMIRLAWHCAGSYRSSDGRGGCDGGRIRYIPEHAWADNTNLDKALELLEPIKLKYGSKVSWGDLITLVGNQAIATMGGPILGFCAGRLDDEDGFDSLELGPSPEQEAVAPCAVNGTCEEPLGTSTVGLIYVNPEGPLGVPDPTGSVDKIRDVFGRMGMNDSETVALIGGGHAFGKFHGACDTGPGADPIDDPVNPWAGTCGDPDDPLFGKGPNTYTSGIEGQWTVEPTLWDTEYFQSLLAYDWEVGKGPGDKYQWHPVLKPGSKETELPDIAMLTTDVALLMDPDYLDLVELYAEDLEALDNSFSNAWYKLTTRDMGPITRCVGSDVPPAQDFQLPLPDPADPPVAKAVYKQAEGKIKSLMGMESTAIDPDMPGGEASYAALFVTLAFQCMDSFRATDYFGGCNGARIRFSPEKDWDVNVNMDKVIEVLEPVKDDYPEITYADLFVLAGNVALKEGGAPDLPFCGGRVDASEGSDLLSVLEPRDYDDVIAGVKDRMKITGLSPMHFVALMGRPRSPSYMMARGFSGSYTDKSNVVSNKYFKVLLTETWEEVSGSSGAEYKAVGQRGVYVLATDLALIWDPVTKAICQEFAGDNELFLKVFAEAWSTWMIADRFDGPMGNVCDEDGKMWY